MAWLDNYFVGGVGPAGPQGEQGAQGPEGPPGESAVTTVTLVGNGTGAGGRFEIGDVVCSANDPLDPTRVKLATATNLANADVASIRVMKETGFALEQKQAAGPGTRLAPSDLGFTAQTRPGVAVVNTTTGRAMQVSAAQTGDYVIGEYDKDGTTTLLPRPRIAKQLSIIEFCGPIYGDGTVNDLPAFDAMIEAAGPGDECLIPIPPVRWMHGPGAGWSPGWRVRDYTGHVKSNIRLTFEGSSGLGRSGTNQIVSNFFDLTAFNTCKITDVSNTGGLAPATFTIDASANTITCTPALRHFAKIRVTTSGSIAGTGLALATDYWLVEQSAGVYKVASSLTNARTNVTIDLLGVGTGTHTATVQSYGQKMATITGVSSVVGVDHAKLRGSYCETWNWTLSGNNLVSTINHSSDDNGGTVVIFNPNVTTGADNGWNGTGGSPTGSIRIWAVGVDLRAAGIYVDGLAVRPANAAGMISELVHLGSGGEAGAGVISACTFEDCYLATDQPATRKFRYGLTLAKSIVTEPGHQNFDTNGAGYYQTYSALQVSECDFYNMRFYGGWLGAAIAGWSDNAQAVQNVFHDTSFNSFRNFAINPVTGNTGISSGLHMEFRDGRLGTPYDIAYDVSPAARAFSCKGDRGELQGGAYLRYRGSAGIGVLVEDVTIHVFGHGAAGGIYDKYMHRSRRLIHTSARGQNSIINCNFLITSDSHRWRFYISSKARYRFAGNTLKGTTGVTSEPAALTSTLRFPISYNDGDVFTLETALGVPQKVTITQAKVNAAMAARLTAYTTDRRELRPFEFAAFVEDNFTGACGWGVEDNSQATILTTTNGTGAWLRIFGEYTATAGTIVAGGNQITGLSNVPFDNGTGSGGPYAGGTLTITGGPNAGTYTIAAGTSSTTATTVTITTTFPSNESNPNIKFTPADWNTCINRKLGFPTGATAGFATQQVTTDTAGWVSAPANTHYRVTFEDNNGIDTTSTEYKLDGFKDKGYGANAKDLGEYHGGGKFGTVAHAPGGTTFSFNFAAAGLNNEKDTNYTVRAVPKFVSAAVASGALQTVGDPVKAVDKVDFTVAADPSTGTVTWLVEILRR